MSSVSAELDLNRTFGAAFIGLLVSAVLYGVTLTQTYDYYRRFPNDSRSTKALVLILWVLDTAHLILSTVATYWYLVVNFNNPTALGLTTTSFNLQTDCNGLIGLLVEVFFARRVWMMSRNWFLTGLIVALACVHCGLGIVFTVEAFILGHLSEFPKLTWVTSAGLGSAAAADIIIAISMCCYLSRSRTGIQRTDNLITTLMVYSLNTGLLTSVVASAAVVTFAALPAKLVWLSFFWVLGKCYVNSLLAALNSREHLREKVAGLEPGGTLVHMTPMTSSSSPPTSPIRESRWSTAVKKGRPPLSVTIETHTTTKADYGSPLSPLTSTRTYF